MKKRTKLGESCSPDELGEELDRVLESERGATHLRRLWAVSSTAAAVALLALVAAIASWMQR